MLKVLNLNCYQSNHRRGQRESQQISCSKWERSVDNHKEMCPIYSKSVPSHCSTPQVSYTLYDTRTTQWTKSTKEKKNRKSMKEQKNRTKFVHLVEDDES